MGRRLVTSSQRSNLFWDDFMTNPPVIAFAAQGSAKVFTGSGDLGSYPRAIEHTHHPRIRANRTHIQVVRQ